MFDTILTAAFVVLFGFLAYGNRDANTNFTRYLFSAQMTVAILNLFLLAHKLGL